MTVERVGVGLIVPSSNTCLEPLVAALLADMPVRMHVTRTRVTRIGLDGEASAQFADAAMLSAAGLLADAGVGLICWGGTSGSWRGVDGDHALCTQITATTGIPATTSTLAMLDAFSALGVHRIGLAVPYTEAVTAAIAQEYATHGIVSVAQSCLGLVDNAAFAAVSEAELDDLVAAVAPRADAVAVVCTNLASAPRVPMWEALHRTAVVDSVTATVWQIRRLLGRAAGAPGWGRLLATASPAKEER